MRIIAVGNYKGGSGKTTSAVYLSEALTALGQRVLLVDADPQQTASRWSHQAGGLRFQVEAHAKSSTGRFIAQVPAARFDTIVVDTPPVQQSAGIVEGILAVCDLAVLPLAPTLPEYERVQDFTAAAAAAGVTDVRALLNRTIPRAGSTGAIRDALTADGVTVMRTEVPRREALAWSFGAAPSGNLYGYLSAAEELSA